MNPTIELPVGELKIALAGLNKISITRSFNPALGCVRVHATSDEVQLQATNLDEFAAFQCSSTNAVEPQEFLVPLEPLNRLVKNINAKATIRLSRKGDQSITLAYPVGGTFLEQNHATVPLSEWPPIPHIQTGAVEVDNKFKSALQAALDCSSDEPTRYILNGAFVDVSDPKANYLVGCDGRHLFAANSFCLGLKESLIIPNRKFIRWSGFLDDGSWLLSAQAANEKEKAIGWVKLQSNHWIFITKQIEGIYPNWRQVIPQHIRTAKTTVEFQPDAVSFLLEVLPKLPGYDEVNQSVSLSIRDQQLTILARKNQSTKTNSAMVVPGCVIQGSPITISVNRGFVLQALKFGFTTMEMSEPESALLFRAEGRKMIVQPLRTDHPKAATAETSETSETPDTTTPPATTIADVEAPEAPEKPDEPTDNPQPQPQTDPQTIQPMAKEITTATTTTEPTQEENASPIKAAIKQIDQIKDTLRKAIWDMHDLVKTLALANKEQRATEKEMDAIRESVRSLQRVKL